MLYFVNIVFSIFYFYLIRKKKFNFIAYFPIFFLWTTIIGFQYYVGTDYPSYIEIYNTDRLEIYFKIKEYLFYYLVKILRVFFENGQVLFVVIAIMYSLLFYYSLKRLCKIKLLNKQYLFIYCFLFLCLSTIFYNQTNGLRNYTAAYFFFLGSTYLLENKKIKYLIFIFLGTLFHRTCIFLVPFLFLNIFIKKRKERLVKFLYISLIVSTVLIFLPIDVYFKEIGIKIFPMYKHYFIRENFIKELPLINQIARLIWLPFYFFSIPIYKKNKNITIAYGIFAYSLSILTIKISILVRLEYYMSFLTLFPIYNLIIDWIKTKKWIYLFIIVSMIFSFIILKLLLLGNEYEYHSYFFS